MITMNVKKDYAYLDNVSFLISQLIFGMFLIFILFHREFDVELQFYRPC